MANQGGFSYKPNVNRAVTKKWKEANQVSYDGDDYGDDDDDDGYGYEGPPVPVSAGNARHPGWGNQGQMYPSNRSVTNPSPPRGGRPSFDRGDERRYFSGGTGGFESAYPSTQRSPFPEPQHDEQMQNYRGPPPLQLHTQGQGPYPPPSFPPTARGPQYPQHPNAPFSAPGGYPHRRSDSGNRSNPGDPYQRRQSPVRPDSQASNNSAKHFPPRKSSLSQQQPPADIPTAPPNFADPAPAGTPPASEVKALPFIRPSDIYKRMEEEREKERRSQESSRPSIDLNTSRTRDSSTSARSASAEPAEPPLEDTDSTRRLKPTLDTVVERKSEYGMDNMLREADRTQPSANAQDSSVNRHPTNASSIYTDRPDPVSAASRDDSPQGMGTNGKPDATSWYNYNLPALGNAPTVGSELGSSPAPAATSRAHEPSQPPPPVPMKDVEQGLNPNTAEDLSHKPSLGYRSVVEQAFDQTEHQPALSPVSGDLTIPRSNSASTSEISPIISRHQDFSRGPSGPPVTQQPIPEEPSFGHSRIMSDSTIKGGNGADRDQPLPAPPTFQSGYRRDRTPPSRDNSPAQQPLSVQTGHQTRPSRGVLDSSEDVHQQMREENARGRAAPPAPVVPPTVGVISPQSQHSTTSEEYKEWQDSRKQFNSRMGIHDSNPTTPGIPSPISRSGSPTKGNVRGLTERYESNSGRSTPVNTTADYLSSRPVQQGRMESFRPQLPGGWQSSTQTPQVETPSQEYDTPLQPPRLANQGRMESTDSIPTAKAPENWQEERHGPARTAFAAAAAAGTALAGAFSGPAFARPGHQAREDSPTRSEDSWERSAPPSIHAPDDSDARDFGAAEAPHGYEAAAQDSLPPTPLPKDSPISMPQPASVVASNLKDEYHNSDEDQRAEDYFPAPLRTSKSVDPNEVMRSSVPAVHHTGTSPLPRDNDQLQDDIVKSLTPKSSNVEVQDQYASSHQTRAFDTNDHDQDATPSRGPAPVPVMTGGAPGAPGSNASARPFLEQRFSWEMDPEGQKSSTPPTVRTSDVPAMQTPTKITSPSTESPDTVRSLERTSTEIPIAESQRTSGAISPSLTRPLSGEEIVAPPTMLKDVGPSPSLPATAPGPHAEVSFRKILAMGSQQQRIQAFEHSRASYAQSDGLLDQWILSMQTTEHADVFQANGSVRPTGSGNTARPSPGRPLPSMSGPKIMQEDGKKLMEASKRFGGKAGVAAKGLFAKGKDKLRSVSATDKGFLTSRRKSTGPDLIESNESQTSKRDSTFLAAPQIPAQDLQSSPIEGNNWFGGERDETLRPAVTKTTTAESSRSLTMLQNSRIDEGSPVQDSQSRSPSISISSRPGTSRTDDLTHEEKHDNAKGHSAGGAAAAAALAAAGAVAASTMTSNKDEEAHTPLDSSIQSEQSARDVPFISEPGSVARPLNTADDHHSSMKDQNLTVPTEQKRLSVVSRVSSASPSLETSQEDRNIHRSVSPAEPFEPHDEAVPSYRPVLSPSKEADAALDRQAADSQGLSDPVPAYNETPATSNANQRPHVGSDAQIVPMADLSQQRRQENIRHAERPFSFEGSEYLNRVIRENDESQPVQRLPSLPLSPVSQTLSKSMSQVSTEEAIDDHEGGQSKKPARSYSRPFGAEPPRDYPAPQQNQAADPRRIYPTGSPLPSARRAQQEFDDVRRPSPAPTPVAKIEEEGGYRIPGPHFQELRSPRRSSGQNHLPAVQQFRQANNIQQPNGTANYALFPQDAQQPLQPPQQEQRQVTSPAPTPREEMPTKKSKFGGFFQTRSKSRQDTETLGSRQGKLVRHNSRQNSVRSQESSTNEKRDVVGQLPPVDKSRNRLSKDMMRSATPTDQYEGKKKRFSGLFSRGSKMEKVSPQRASTLPTNAGGPVRPSQPPSAPGSQYYDRPDPVQNHAYPPPLSQGAPAPPGGYYAPRQQHVNSTAQYPQQNHTDYQQPSQSYTQQYDKSPQYDNRPFDLRIDTASGGRGSPSYNVPATAPPQTHASRDISYSPRPYEHAPASARVQSPVTATAATAPASSSHDAHVVGLHKRSRSPKLGRRTSSEDLRKLSPPAAGSDTPVDGLGTFTSKRISPAGGIPRPAQDQEAPYRIDIPGRDLGEDERKRRTRQNLIEKSGIRESEAARATSPVNGHGQTVAERVMGPQLPAAGVKAAKKESPTASGSSERGHRFVAELPGSRADGYESDDEIIMSATAGPGMWQDPVFFGEGKWDD